LSPRRGFDVVTRGVDDRHTLVAVTAARKVDVLERVGDGVALRRLGCVLAASVANGTGFLGVLLDGALAGSYPLAPDEPPHRVSPPICFRSRAPSSSSDWSRLSVLGV